MSKATKFHFFMIAALCAIVDAKDKDKINDPNVQVNVNHLPVNVLLTQNERELTKESIARIQQGAQKTLFNFVPHDSVEVVNVVIQSISHLGFMTEAKFHGLKTQAELEAEARAIAAAAGVKGPTLSLVPKDEAVNDAQPVA